MKTLTILITSILLTSCLPTRLANRIEHSNDMFWNQHKALLVDSIKEKKYRNKYYCSHPLTDYVYRFEEFNIDTIYNVGDTLPLNHKLRSKMNY